MEAGQETLECMQDRIIKRFQLDKLDSLLSMCEDEIVDYITKKEVKIDENNTNFILNTLGKCFVSAREIIVLCQAGLPEGALSISRNIYEQFITVAYVESKIESPKFDILLKRYFAHAEIEQANLIKFEAENVANDQNEAQKCVSVIKEIGDKYNIKAGGKYWWTGEIHTFKEMYEYVAKTAKGTPIEIFIHRMHAYYILASKTIHASFAGNSLRFGSRFIGIDCGPREFGQENALFLMTASFIYIMGYTFKLLNIERDDIVDEFNVLANLYCNYCREALKE